jgi:hypothetical protein
MASDNSKDKEIPIQNDAYYEEVACQEEVYLEETEEELRAILVFDDTCPSQSSSAGNPDEQLGHAAEELISGDSDDPPLSEQVVVEMVEVTVNAQRRKPEDP